MKSYLYLNYFVYGFDSQSMLTFPIIFREPLLISAALFTAIGIISVIGTNMETFPSAIHLCSWAGLTPISNESAGKKKSVRVSKAGCYIKPLLIQCANAVVKSAKHPEMPNRYLRLKKRRGHKNAIIAIARMLLTALYR